MISVPLLAKYDFLIVGLTCDSSSFVSSEGDVDKDSYESFDFMWKRSKSSEIFECSLCLSSSKVPSKATMPFFMTSTQSTHGKVSRACVTKILVLPLSSVHKT